MECKQAKVLYLQNLSPQAFWCMGNIYSCMYTWWPAGYGTPRKWCGCVSHCHYNGIIHSFEIKLSKRKCYVVLKSEFHQLKWVSCFSMVERYRSLLGYTMVLVFVKFRIDILRRQDHWKSMNAWQWCSGSFLAGKTFFDVGSKWGTNVLYINSALTNNIIILWNYVPVRLGLCTNFCLLHFRWHSFWALLLSGAHCKLLVSWVTLAKCTLTVMRKPCHHILQRPLSLAVLAWDHYTSSQISRMELLTGINQQGLTHGLCVNVLYKVKVYTQYI